MAKSSFVSHMRCMVTKYGRRHIRPYFPRSYFLPIYSSISLNISSPVALRADRPALFASQLLHCGCLFRRRADYLDAFFAHLFKILRVAFFGFVEYVDPFGVKGVDYDFLGFVVEGVPGFFTDDEVKVDVGAGIFNHRSSNVFERYIYASGPELQSPPRIPVCIEVNTSV